MAQDVDLSRPLSQDEIAQLRTRYPTNVVDHMVGLAAGSDFEAPSDLERVDPGQARAMQAEIDRLTLEVQTVTAERDELAGRVEQLQAAVDAAEPADQGEQPNPGPAGGGGGGGDVKIPDGNDSTEDWRAYAVSQGADPEAVAKMGRNDLRAAFGGQSQD